MKHVVCAAFLAAILVVSGCGWPIVDGSPSGYVTHHGLLVFIGEDNSPSKYDVQDWTEDAVRFWKSFYLPKTTCMWNHTGQTRASFVDEDHVVDEDGAKFAGLQYDHRIFISNGPAFKIRGVFIHELSHVLAAYCLGFPGNDESHAEFDRRGLKALTKY